MIYTAAEPTQPIRQADIFRAIPRIEAELDQLPVVIKGGVPVEMAWKDRVAVQGTDAVTAVVSIWPVDAIVVTQDCDAVRSPEIAMCQIYPFPEIENRASDAKSPRSWMRIITQHARVNLKWFYLPGDDAVGFTTKMGVDFRQVLRVPRNQLEQLTASQRVGRLNDLAAEHFRERLAEFFRRYPYDEWYPLTRDELAAYRRSKPEPIEAYPWQE